MKYKESFSIYRVDAFTDKIFSGNPAAVCVLSQWFSEEILNAIAKENNLPVSAFLVRNLNNYEIRWITPDYELDICGHGSMAAAYIIFNYLEPSSQKIGLQSRTEVLTIVRNNDLITLNFPVKNIELCSLPLLEKGLGFAPQQVYQHNNERCLAVFQSQQEVEELRPDMEILRTLPHRGVIVTAPGTKADFVSRTFYPHKTISEDSVTGASHCILIPYWSKQLNKTKMYARQVSQRGGEIFCEYKDTHVLISGKAVMNMQGTSYI